MFIHCNVWCKTVNVPVNTNCELDQEIMAFVVSHIFEPMTPPLITVFVSRNANVYHNLSWLTVVVIHHWWWVCWSEVIITGISWLGRYNVVILVREPLTLSQVGCSQDLGPQLWLQWVLLLPTPWKFMHSHWIRVHDLTDKLHSF